jgi:HEAT repeat protein
MKFQKGQSGNPGGRPKVIGDVQALAREHTPEAVQTLANIMRDVEAAPAARVAAANAILDRGYGKPLQQISAEVSQRYVAELPEVCEDGDDWERQYAPKRH